MIEETPLVHLKEHAEVIEADIATIRGALPAGARVVDIGAGRGSFVSKAALAGYHAFGLEMDTGAGRLWARDRVPGVLGSGAALPFREGAFDLVRMKEVIEHVEEPLLLVREARRVLRPGGLLIAHTPTPYSQLYPIGNFWDDYTHVRPFSRLGLTRLVADAGLEILRIEAYVSGRNGLERAIGKLLARVFPHIYKVTARRPDA